MGRRITVVVFSVLTVVVIGMVVVVLSPWTAERSAIKAARQRAAEIESPTPDSAQEARSYLAADGRPLIAVMHAEARAQLAEGDGDAGICRDRAARLDSTLPMSDVLTVLDDLPDSSTRDAFHAERTALGLAITRCAKGGALTPRDSSGIGIAAADLELAVGLVETRLEALGVDQ